MLNALYKIIKIWAEERSKPLLLARIRELDSSAPRWPMPEDDLTAAKEKL